MADEIDIANERADAHIADAVERARRVAAEIPEGVSGECLECGEHSPRLVHGVCAPCRDEFARRRQWVRYA